MSIGKGFASHETVAHGKDEYVRGDVYTNTVEGYFSVFKRGMKGVDDRERTDAALTGIVGKRLTYRWADA